MKERVISLCILVFSLIYLAGSIGLKVGTTVEPGPGMVPAGIAVALLITSAYNAYKAFRKAAKKDGESWFQLAPIGIGVSLILYPVMLEYLNYLISTFIVMFALLWIMRFKTLRIQLLTALLTSVLSFVIFANLLGVVLPSGFLEGFLTIL